MGRFNVALWRRWPSLFPEHVDDVEADNAFSAVVQVMHTYGYTWVEHAAAAAYDGSLMYRAYHVAGVPRGWVWFAGRGVYRDASRPGPPTSDSI